MHLMLITPGGRFQWIISEQIKLLGEIICQSYPSIAASHNGYYILDAKLRSQVHAG
jgi:hypothetical protein